MLTADDIFKANRNLAIRKNSKRAAYSFYTPRRTDKNQKDIVKAFRDLGAKVTLLHASGNGVYDLLVAISFLVASVEVKDPNKGPSQRRLTEAQRNWGNTWSGLRYVAMTTEDVQSICFEMRVILSAFLSVGLIPKKAGCKEAQYAAYVTAGGV